MAEAIANLGWNIASSSNIPPNPTTSGASGSSTGGATSGSSRNYSTQAGTRQPGTMAYSTSRDREIPGLCMHVGNCDWVSQLTRQFIWSHVIG